MKTNETSRRALSDYLKLRYPVTVQEDPEGGYVAMVKDLPGCITQGETLEETMSNIQEAKELWLEVAWEKGGDIPLPSSGESFSGKI